MTKTETYSNLWFHFFINIQNIKIDNHKQKDNEDAYVYISSLFREILSLMEKSYIKIIKDGIFDYKISYMSVYDNYNFYLRDMIIEEELYDDLRYIVLYLVYMRDQYYGQGMRTIFYKLLSVLYDFFPSISYYIILSLVYSNTEYNLKDKVKYPYINKQYGSWRDIYGIISETYRMTKNKNSPIIYDCIELYTLQLLEDINNIHYSNPISNVAKWIPRENKLKKNEKWIYHTCRHVFFKKIKNMYSYIKNTNNYKTGSSIELMDTDISYDNLRAKYIRIFDTIFHIEKIYKGYNEEIENNEYPKNSNKLFRRIISYLNQYGCSTIEIYMCNQRWNMIQIENVRIPTILKYSKSFLDTKTRNKKKFKFTKKVIQYIQKKHSYNNFNHLSINYLEKLVKKSIRLYSSVRTHIERVWIHKCSEYIFNHNINEDKFHNILPILNLEEGNDELLYKNISFALFIAKRNVYPFKNRILIVHHNPIWINIENCYDFTEMVKLILSYKDLSYEYIQEYETLLNDNMNINNSLYKSTKFTSTIYYLFNTLHSVINIDNNDNNNDNINNDNNNNNNNNNNDNINNDNNNNNNDNINNDNNNNNNNNDLLYKNIKWVIITSEISKQEICDINSFIRDYETYTETTNLFPHIIFNITNIKNIDLTYELFKRKNIHIYFNQSLSSFTYLHSMKKLLFVNKKHNSDKFIYDDVEIHDSIYFYKKALEHSRYNKISNKCIEMAMEQFQFVNYISYNYLKQ